MSQLRLRRLEPDSAAHRRFFVRLQWRFYRDFPLWVPPLRVEAEKLLNPKRNPFFAQARMQLFVAERDGEAVGRIAAILNELHNQIHGDQVGFSASSKAFPMKPSRACYCTLQLNG
jgi:hypothetical protein